MNTLKAKFANKITSIMDFISQGFRYASIFLVLFVVGSLVFKHRVNIDTGAEVSVFSSILVYTVESLIRRALVVRNDRMRRRITIYTAEGKSHTITIDTSDEEKLDEFNEALEEDIAQRASPELIGIARERVTSRLNSTPHHGNV